MSKLTMALTVATIASAGASTYLWQELGDEREQRTTLQSRVMELERSQPIARSAPPVELIDPAPLPENPPAAPENPQPPAPAMRPTGALPAPAMSGVWSATPPDPELRRRIMESREQHMRMLKDPEYRELMRSQHRLGLEQAYADLGPLLGLTADEADRLLDVLAEHSIRNMEQPPMFGPTPGAPPDQADIRERQQAFAEQRKNNEAEIAAVLGPKYGEWQAYQQNGWARGQVTRLRQTLALSGEPLRQDQIKPLVDAIAREQSPAQMASPYTISGRPNAEMQARTAEDMLERTRQSNERIRMAASGWLSPAQLEQLQRQQERELKMQELAVRQQRARAEAQARGELPPDAAGSPNLTAAYPW